MEAELTEAPRTLPVLVAPMPDPGLARRELAAPEGLTVAEIVDLALPGLTQAARADLRVTLVGETGAAVADPAFWTRIRPRPGVRVVIRVVPGEDAFRAVALIVVAVVAAYVAPYLAPYIASAFGVSTAAATSIATTALTLVGTLLVNALIPIAAPGGFNQLEAAPASYRISGLRNRARPGQPVPLALGRHRYAPPFAAHSYTEISGDEQYIRALFCFGYGRLDISDLRLGDTPLDEFDDVEIEVREGAPDDEPVTLYPRQILEEAVSVELVRPRPRDESGRVVNLAVVIDPRNAWTIFAPRVAAPGVETPVVRWTAADAAEASVLISFPSGLFMISGEGDVWPRTVSIRIRQRPEAGGDWEEVTTLGIRSRNRSAFYRQHTWTLPSRGRWQVEVTRMTDETLESEVSDRSYFAGLQSIRPEYPVALDKPLALVAMRIRATHQINGALDTFNAVIQRYAPVWDGEAWTDGLTRNPASALLAALQGPSSPFPAGDAEIDLDLIADWHDWCAEKGLKYDAIHEGPESLGDMLAAICAAGRASPRHDGLKWGVVIDRPQDVVIDHVSSRNSADFSWSRTYFEAPDAFRVPFIDETNGWSQAERIVPWPGHEGAIDLTESLELPGKTDPDEIWIEARRRQYELIHRADRFEVTQDGAARAATRGDKVMASFDTLDRTQRAARIVAIDGRLLQLDEHVEAEDGVAYAIRFRVYADEEDTIGTSQVLRVEVIPEPLGPSRLLRALGTAALPAVGDMVHFGVAGTDSFALRVRSVEAGESLSSILTFVADAPEVDALTDAETPPAWNGRVGEEVDYDPVAPAVPVFAGILSGILETSDQDGLRVLLAPGSGSGAPVASYELQHRLVGAPSWTDIAVPAASAGAEIDAYVRGDAVELRARALAADGTAGDWTEVIEIEIGVNDGEAPAALDEDAIAAQGGLGHVALTIAAPDDDALESIQLYLVPDGDTLDPDVHAAGAAFAVGAAGTTFSHVHGDATRVNLLSDPGFDNPAAWTAEAGWAVTGGAATRTPGTADTIRQALVPTVGATYRYAVTIAGRTAGSVAPTLFSGTPVAGTAETADGLALGELVAASGNDAFGFDASSDFDGALDDAVLYRRTAACVAAGVYEVWLAPQNLAGVAGPLSGPFSVTIV